MAISLENGGDKEIGVGLERYHINERGRALVGR